MEVVIIPRAGAADISAAAATTNSTFECPFAGKLNVEASYLEWTEETGTQATTQGVVGIYVGGTLVGSLTANIADVVGEVQKFTVDGTVATTAQPFAEFSAGDDIACKTVTQAVDAGGTITGDGTIYLVLEYAV